jgi:hypothetical protein
MQDEIDYLKVEVNSIASRIKTDFPERRAALGADPLSRPGDEYVVRSFDFTDSLTTFQSQLSRQMADGGGDYPEAPEQALSKLTTLTFSQNAAARMAFWIADAPHHDANAATMVNDILLAQRLGIPPVSDCRQRRRQPGRVHDARRRRGDGRTLSVPDRRFGDRPLPRRADHPLLLRDQPQPRDVADGGHGADRDEHRGHARRRHPDGRRSGRGQVHARGRPGGRSAVAV